MRHWVQARKEGKKEGRKEGRREEEGVGPNKR
jgi:hypothetical protein